MSGHTQLHNEAEYDAVYLTIIVPVWNGADCIGKCLDAIGRQSHSLSNVQVIVIDNGSTDETANIVKRYRFAELLHEPAPGSYRARNLGLSKAKGKFVIFTDGDCIPEPDWIDSAISLSTKMEPTEIIGGQIKLFREPGAGNIVSTFEELTAFNQEVNVQYGFCVTANWLCRTDLIRNIGGFDSDLLSGGDLELSKRLAEKGCTFRYAPELLVHHPTRATMSGMIRKRRRVIGGKWRQRQPGSEGALFLMRKNISDAFNQARWMVKAPGSPITKMGVMMVIALLTAVSQLELIRLAAGFSPYRD